MAVRTAGATGAGATGAGYGAESAKAYAAIPYVSPGALISAAAARALNPYSVTAID